MLFRLLWEEVGCIIYTSVPLRMAQRLLRAEKVEPPAPSQHGTHTCYLRTRRIGFSQTKGKGEFISLVLK